MLLLPLVLASFAQQPEPVAQERIDAAVEKGRAFLSHAYQEALERGKLDALERVGQSALSLYTLLKSGAEPRSDVVQELLLEISLAKVEHTYDAACVLLALSAHDPMANRPWIDELAQQLIAWQMPEGDWAYAEAGADLSNTQFAALVLWAASRAGFEAPSKVWLELARATMRYGDEEGAFGYALGSGRGRTGSGSMTVAGIGTLAICETRLRRANALPEELGREIAVARERGLAWMAKHFTPRNNPRSGAWLYYYLYGVERLGAFCAAPRLGEHDWYDEGARFLVQAQGEDGSWNSGTDLSETCFALLFLRRATADAPRGPATGDDVPKDDGAALRIEAEGSGPVALQVAGWRRKEVQSLEWPGERGLGPHVAAVEYYVDGELVAVEVGSTERPAGGSRFRTTQVFRKAGAHKVKARALLRAPDGKEVVLDSAEIEVQVEHPLPAWLDEPRPSALDDQLPKMKASAKASSVAKGKDAPFSREWSDEYAIDGNPRTPWLAAAKDEKRQLSITCSKGDKSKVVQVRAAVLAPLGPTFLARPTEIEISINGKSHGVLALSPDPLQPARLVLDEPTQIKRIDLQIVAVAAGDASPLVGIGEVELFASDDR